eukprot:m.28874 g.28874  ORF g.28874 m.28874 type:complete len:90 (-) comp10483_c0_seq1:178-447(-)
MWACLSLAFVSMRRMTSLVMQDQRNDGNNSFLCVVCCCCRRRSFQELHGFLNDGMNADGPGLFILHLCVYREWILLATKKFWFMFLVFL